MKLVKDIRDWIKSITFLNRKHNIFHILIYFLGSVFVGYTATAFPSKFLMKFEHPFYQFLIFWALGLVLFYEDLPHGGWFLIFDSIMFVGVLQLMLYFAKKFSNVKHQHRVYDLHIRYTDKGAVVKGKLPTSKHVLKWKWNEVHGLDRLEVWSEIVGETDDISFGGVLLKEAATEEETETMVPFERVIEHQ